MENRENMLHHYKPGMVAKLCLIKGPAQAVKEIPLTGNGLQGLFTDTSFAATGDLVVFKSNETYAALEFVHSVENEWRVRPWISDKYQMSLWGRSLNHTSWSNLHDGDEVQLTFWQGIYLQYRFTYFAVPFVPTLLGDVQVTPDAVFDDSMLLELICSVHINVGSCVVRCEMSKFSTEPFTAKRILDGVLLVPVPSLCNDVTFAKNFNEFAKALIICINMRKQHNFNMVARYREEIDAPQEYIKKEGRMERASRKDVFKFYEYMDILKHLVMDRFLRHLQCVICAKQLCNARTLKCGHVSCVVCYRNIGKRYSDKRRIDCPCQINTTGFLLVAHTPYVDEIRRRLASSPAYVPLRARSVPVKRTIVKPSRNTAS